MSYEKDYTVNPAHIDMQDIVDGLYYPFYMEYCRHDYIREILGIDIVEAAEKGVFLVLSGYKINFLRSLKKEDQFTVSCELFGSASGRPVLYFKQTICCKNKIMTEALFTGTCIPAGGGRPYIPEILASILAQAPVLEKEFA